MALTVALDLEDNGPDRAAAAACGKLVDCYRNG
jgi:hypothetical protein